MSNSKIYFLHYSEKENAIHSNETKMFCKLKDVKSFVSEHSNLSGYVTSIDYNGNTGAEKGILGFFNGFEPSAMEGEFILKVLERKLTDTDLNERFKF